MSNRATDVLNYAGRLKIFEFKHFGNWSITDYIKKCDYVFFDISYELTMEYISSQFLLLKEYPVVLLKHSFENEDENLIKKISEILECTVISHIPEERRKHVLDTLLTSTVALIRPVPRWKRILKNVFQCIAKID